MSVKSSIKNFFEKTRLYLASYLGDRRAHEGGGKNVSIILAPLPFLLIINNYFTLLKAKDKHNWKGLGFLFLSIAYGLYCLWLCVEDLFLKLKG